MHLDAPQSILETGKNPKTLSSGQKTPKNPLGWFFLKKTGFFPTLTSMRNLVDPDPQHWSAA